MIKEPTWIIHGVCDKDKDTVVYHTHGLEEYNSLELELNLSLEQKQAMRFLNLIGLKIANGIGFKDGDSDNSIFNCEVFFKEVDGIYRNGNRRMLRVILPDPNFKFPWENGCAEPYKSQL
ncbi:DUF4262 domain-containing protein [Clostridium botulinum]